MSKLKELTSLQVLRAVAAIAIVMAHVNRITEIYLNVNLHFSFAVFHDWGIDLFFVISGFIIFYTHFKDFGNAERLRNFLKKRFLRIYPTYWLVTLILLPIFFIFPGIGSGYERDISVIIKSLMLFPQSHSPILFVGWTLVHEIRFYLIFALLIYKKRLGIIIASLILLGTLFRYIGNINTGNFLIDDYLLSYYNWEFFLGCVASYLLISTQARLVKALLASSMVLTFVVVLLNQPLKINETILQLSFDNSLLIRQRIFLLGIPFAMILYLLARLELKTKVVMPKFLMYLGAASYSMYLIHYLFISLLLRVVIKTNLFHSSFFSYAMFIVALVSIAGGCLFYSLVEKPLLKYLKTR